MLTKDQAAERLGALRKKRSRKDKLTRLHNRRWFAEIFWNEVLGWFAKD